MNKENLNKILPLLFLILVSGGALWWQASYRTKLIAENVAYKQFLQAELARIERERQAELRVYLMGDFETSTHPDFAMVPAKYSVSGYTMYLRREALEAFTAMEAVAAKDGVRLRIGSAGRNFDYQKMIWNNKWLGYTLVEGQSLPLSAPNSEDRFNKILEYSAVPGTSRHHWGTEVDLNHANPEYFRTAEGIKVYDWLVKNAPSFGFCQPYNAQDASRPTGYNEEKWHWSYLPLAKSFTQEYSALISPDDIKGFRGDENVTQGLIRDYVLGINPECL